MSSEPRARMFIAVQPTASAVRGVEKALESIRGLPGASELRWVEPEKLHFTLRFLGSVPVSLRGALAAVCDEVANRHAPFALTLSGGGAFPSQRRASVLWVGATDGADALCALAEALGRGLDALGFEREARAFKPHLTLARSKRPLPLTASVEALAGFRESTGVRELVLVQSHLGKPAARYEVLERAVLRG
jgi:2'-5' RNA ligase